MIFGYANGNARRAVATQREVLEAFGVTRIWADEKGEAGDWEHLTGEQTGIGRDGPHSVVVAEFHLLATNRADLIERVLLVHARGSWIVEAATGRQTHDLAHLIHMLLEATDFYYQGGMSKAERQRIAKLGAAASPVTKPKDGRMPLTEAIKFLYDVSLTIREAIAHINRDRRYRRKWSLSYAYQRNKAGDIKLPQRIAGPKLKRIS
jgi:hypothetical protein